MRNFVLFLATVLTLASCSNVEQYREAIETLATNWDSATNTVTALADEVKQATESAQTSIAGMNVDEETMAQMDDTAKEQLAGLIQNATGQSTALTGITEQITTFVGEWTEKSAKLNELKEGLASGSLPADVTGTIASLTEAVSGASTKVEGWKEQLASAKTALASIVQQHGDLLASLTGGE